MSDHSSGDGSFQKSPHRSLTKNHYNRQYNAPPMHLEDLPPPPSMLQRKDIEAINFLSAPQKVYQIISAFDQRKRDIVQSIGFGGILKLPFIRTENKAFSYWILFHMRWYNACIAVGDNIRLTLTEEHNGKITGLNSTGHDISDRWLKTVDEKLAFMATRIPFLGSNNGVLNQAELFVQEDLPSVISKESLDNFKTAFVIFVMGTFLAPTSDNPDGSTNFWGALQNPDQIASFNWCSYVLSNIKSAARLVNSPKTISNPLSTLIGCPLILQIFYLDNIDFGELNLKHEIFPRWEAYSDEYINAMVAADNLTITTPWSPPVFGKHEGTRLASICYTINHHPASHTASGSAASPRVRRLRQRRSSVERSVSPDISDDDNSRQLAIDPAGSESRSPSNTFDNNLFDFNAFLRRNFQGQVDSRLTEELKKYNSNCSNIISTSHRALASSIANENAQFATRLLEYFNNPPHSNNCFTPYSNLPPRRRRANELIVGTDSSTDGEDTNSVSKKPRSSSPCLQLPCATNAGALLNNSDALQKNVKTKHGISYNKTVPSITTAQKVSSPLHYKSDTSPLPLQANSSKCYSPAQMNHADFVTPLPTLRMRPAHGLCPTVDDTTLSPSFFPALRLDEINGFDLSPANIDDDCNIDYPPKKIAVTGPSCKSHFFLNLEHLPVQTEAMKDFYNWVSNANSQALDSNWIISNIHRGLSISGHDLKDQFVLNKTMNFEVFDTSIRRFNELDSVIYQPILPLRWRHLLESDFSRNVLCSEYPAEKKPVVDQFVGQSVDHEVSRCRLFFVPMFASGAWCCYSWDANSSVVYIIDPTASSPKDEVIIKKHSRSIEQLSAALTSTASELFTGWIPKFESSKVAVVRIAGMPYSSKASGLITLFCIWNFDGNRVSVHANVENFAKFKAFLLSQIMSIRDNRGNLPSSFTMNLV